MVLSTVPVLKWVPKILLPSICWLMFPVVAHAESAGPLPPVAVPESNPITEAKIALGKQLYFDPRLSSDNTISCASCHDPKKGWGDGEVTSPGVGGKRGGRNAPTVLNSAYHRFQFWDGRANSLEEQAKGPILNPIEMAMPAAGDAVKKIQAIEGYRKQFEDVFGGPVTYDRIAEAIATFERTVVSSMAPVDRYKAGEETAMSASAIRGMKLFEGKAHCAACHPSPLYTDRAFHNIGVSIDKGDVGREEVSKMEGDRGAFKTPSLRDIAHTGPYMHDGSQATLEDVVRHYDKGGTPNPQLDEEIFELELTDSEAADLLQFLKEGLSSDSYPDVEPPKLPE